MKIVIDMNLSPTWRATLEAGGHIAAHWSAIGDPRASDREIMNWARANGHLVFTHDLDFSAILASTNAAGPSVIQMRSQEVLPQSMGQTILDALHQFASDLEQGAIITIEDDRLRVRILPLSRKHD